MEELLNQVVQMSRYLGAPGRGYAILGEGNTSVRVDDDTFYIKASGTTLETIDRAGFVGCSIKRVLAILDDEDAGDDEVSQVFKECLIDPNEKRRPSVEAMLHAILLSVPEYRFIGHTHPTYTNAILCSNRAEEAAAGRIFPDHIVSMKHKSVYIPYVDPGLTLAREVKKRFEAYVEEEGALPSTILMQNHGLICMGSSPKSITSATDMCEKASKILVNTYALGGPRWMTPHDIERIHTRPDEHYRLSSIAGIASGKN